MLRFVEIAVGTGSPLSCARCATPVPIAYAGASAIIAEIDSAVAEWASSPGPNILLVGPEPFAHPELPVLVGACVRAGVERIGVETDGGALSAHGNAAGALAAGVTNLVVRVLALGDDGVAPPVGGRELTRRAAEGVRTYREAAERSDVRVAVTALVPVCRHTIAHLPGTVAELAAWGLDAVRLKATASAIAAVDGSAVVAAACDTGMVNRLWVEVDPALPLPDSHALHRIETGATDG